MKVNTPVCSGHLLLQNNTGALSLGASHQRLLQRSLSNKTAFFFLNEEAATAVREAFSPAPRASGNLLAQGAFYGFYPVLDFGLQGGKFVLEVDNPVDPVEAEWGKSSPRRAATMASHAAGLSW